jgi:nucleoside-diphosphate-sugar epimerase
MGAILITGVPGWLGNRLVRVLLDTMTSSSDSAGKNKIRCLILPGQHYPWFSKGNGVEIIEGDLRDPLSLKTFCRDCEGATLFHCAGVVHPARRTREFFDVNVMGARNILQVCESAHLKRAVVVSSNSAAGVNPSRDHLFDEDTPCKPYMGYGRSKKMMEQVVNDFQSRGNLETVVVRPTWFYGPEHPRHLTTFFRMIRRGVAPVVGDGENLRSMTYIDNLCQALLLCEKNPEANGQTYWISDSRPYTMNEIIGTIERLMECEFGLSVTGRRLRLPSLVGDIAWMADNLLQNLGFYNQKTHVLSEMNKNIACSIEKARCQLGYNPLVSLEEGMRRAMAWSLSKGLSL